MPENPFEPPREVGTGKPGGVSRIAVRLFLGTAAALSAIPLFVVMILGPAEFGWFFAMGVTLFGTLLALHVWLE